MKDNRIVAFLIVLLFYTAISCKKEPNAVLNPTGPTVFYRAADLSFLPQIRADASGFNTFYNTDSIAQDALEIFANAGCNTVRIRLWHSPATARSGLAEVAAFAEEVHAKGMRVWLTVHYSDWWADPGNQNPPNAWKSLDINTLADSVRSYSQRVAARIQPEIFQVGNEINNGFLWPSGHINNPSGFHKLLHAGIKGVRLAAPKTKIMLHYAGLNNAKTFYSWLDTLDFDQIGLSYYPKWHNQNLNAIASMLFDLGDTFDKEILWAELAYPFTLGWNDWTNNMVGDSTEIVSNFPPTPQGQNHYLGFMRSLIENTNKGSGFCYWAPEWIAYRGPQAQDGSPWENQALFNFNNRALPAIQIFNE